MHEGMSFRDGYEQDENPLVENLSVGLLFVFPVGEEHSGFPVSFSGVSFNGNFTFGVRISEYINFRSPERSRFNGIASKLFD